MKSGLTLRYVWDLDGCKSLLAITSTPQVRAILTALIVKGVSEYSREEMIAFWHELCAGFTHKGQHIQLHSGMASSWKGVFEYYSNLPVDGFRARGLLSTPNPSVKTEVKEPSKASSKVN